MLRITLEDIQKAKALLARAEAALGVAQPKAKVMFETIIRALQAPGYA